MYTGSGPSAYNIWRHHRVTNFDYVLDDCVAFVERQARELDLPVQKFGKSPEKPVLVISWVGQEPELPSILLNGHMDVVPVFEVCRTHIQ